MSSLFLRSLLRSRPHLRRLQVAPVSRQTSISPVTVAAAIGAVTVATFTGAAYASSGNIDPPASLGVPSSLLEKPPESLPGPPGEPTGPSLQLHERVQALIGSGDLESATAAFKSALKPSNRRDAQPHVRTSCLIMSALLNAERYDDVLDLYESFQQSNTVLGGDCFHAFISSSCTVGRSIDDVLKSFDRVARRLSSNQVNPETYELLVKLLMDAGRIGEALDLLKRMVEQGHGDASLAVRTVTQGFVEGERADKDIDKVLGLFTEAKRRYENVVDPLTIHAYLDQGKEEEAMDCYRQMCDGGFYPSLFDPSTFNALLTSLIARRKDMAALKLFEKILEYHKPPHLKTADAKTCHIMVQHKIEMGKLEAAVKLFRRIAQKVEMDYTCYEYIIRHLCNRRRVSEAEKLFNEMLEKSVSPIEQTYEHLIDGCFREGRIEDALSYLDKMLGSHVPVDARLFNKVFVELMKAKGGDKALGVLDKMLKKNVKPDGFTEIFVTDMGVSPWSLL